MSETIPVIIPELIPKGAPQVHNQQVLTSAQGFVYVTSA